MMIGPLESRSNPLGVEVMVFRTNGPYRLALRPIEVRSNVHRDSLWPVLDSRGNPLMVEILFSGTNGHAQTQPTEGSVCEDSIQMNSPLTRRKAEVM